MNKGAQVFCVVAVIASMLQGVLYSFGLVWGNLLSFGYCTVLIGAKFEWIGLDGCLVSLYFQCSGACRSAHPIL